MNILQVYLSEISKIFDIGVNILNGSRSLKRISLDLKLLAINGIVQAAKFSNNKGQSLITLTGFLSDLPKIITPELDDLEAISSHIARQITFCTIKVTRMIKFSSSIYKILSKAGDKSYYSSKSFDITSDINLLRTKELKILLNNLESSDLNFHQIKSIKLIIGQNTILLNQISDSMKSIKNLIITTEKKIDRIHRDGFIANYIGSYISIESSYLRGGRSMFDGLINNINNMYKKMDDSMNSILNHTSRGKDILTNLIQSGSL
jgi:hypothetical protein